MKYRNKIDYLYQNKAEFLWAQIECAVGVKLSCEEKSRAILKQFIRERSKRDRDERTVRLEINPELYVDLSWLNMEKRTIWIEPSQGEKRRGYVESLGEKPTRGWNMVIILVLAFFMSCHTYITFWGMSSSEVSSRERPSVVFK